MKYEKCEKNILGLQFNMKICADKEFVIGVDCKAFAENTMLKRIFVAFTLFKQVYPNLPGFTRLNLY